MAINLHEKYAKELQNAYTAKSYVKGRLQDKVSFVGVKTVKISTLTTVPLGDYTRSGTSRYGTAEDVQDTIQEMTMTQDKAFTAVIDKGDNLDQQGIKAAGVWLNQELDERAVPLYDQYCFGRLVAGAGLKLTGNLAKTDIAEILNTAVAAMDDELVPAENRTLFIPPAVYSKLKTAPEMLGNEAISGKALSKGQVGEYSGMTVVKVPASRLGANVNFLIVHKDSATAPVKLMDTKIHKDPPGVSGNLIEGRQYYDCFVFDVRKNGIYAHTTA